MFAALFATVGCGGKDGDDVPGDALLPTVAGIRHVVVSGSPLEMGRAHGRELKREIRRRLAWLRFKDVAQSAALLAPAMRDLLPPSYADELRGIAQGADVDVDELFLNEVGREIQWWHDQGRRLHAAFASAPGATPCVAVAYEVVGEIGSVVIVERHPTGGVATTMLGYAGSLGGIAGVSARGVVAVSAEDGSLPAERRSLRGPPFAAGLRIALERGGDAETALATVPKLLGHRVLLADAANRRITARVAGVGDDPVRSDPGAWVLEPARVGDERARNGLAQDRALGAFAQRPGCDDAVALAEAGRDPTHADVSLRFANGRVEVRVNEARGFVDAPR